MEPTDTTAFVGRARPWARLTAALDDVVAGRPRVVLVSGESGIGKTTLLAELARRARNRATVGWGTALDGGGAPGFWPWLQAVGDAVAISGAAADTPLHALKADRADGDFASERLELFASFARWLRDFARGQPLVLVLDDLQWADRSSIELLDFVVRANVDARLLIAGAYRSDELPEAHGRLLAGMAARVEHVGLVGLAADEVTKLVARIAGEAQADVWSASLFERTGGHPYFVRELAEFVADSRLARVDALDVPDAVRAAVRRRLDRLDARSRAILMVAATIGKEARVSLVVEASAATADDVEAARDNGIAVGVLRSADDTVRFVHDIVRELLASEVPPADRPALHDRVATALECSTAVEASPSVVALHATAALPTGLVERALRWALAAAAADRDVLALAESAAHLARLRVALDERCVAATDAEWVALLAAEAAARARAGDADEARRLLGRASTHAARRGEPADLAAVAFGFQRLGARFSMPRHAVVEAIEAARQAAHEVEPVLEAQLTAALARELHHSVAGERGRAGPLSQAALALARETGDPDALLLCLLARHDVLWTPGTAAERVGIAEDLVALATRLHDEEHRVEGLLLVANARLEEGSPACRAAVGEYLDAVEATGQPRDQYLARSRRAAVALLDGHLDEAARLIDEATRLGRGIGEPDTGNVRMSQRLELVRARGDARELCEFAGEAVEWWVGAPAHAHAVAAGFYARAGDLASARRELDVVLELGAWTADRSYLWSVFVGALVDAAARLGVRDLCRDLVAELAPLGETCGVNGAFVAFAGSHAHFAGVAAAGAGDLVAARRHLTLARRVHARLGAVSWLAETDAALADLGSGGGGVAVMRAGDRTWAITFGAERIVVPASKGWSDIAELVSRAGREVNAVDLAGATVDQRGIPAAADRRAVAAYRERLDDLDAELSEAQSRHDEGTRARLVLEREALLAEVSAAAGLGGRARAAGSTSERARKAVAARIRDAIRHISVSAPGLAAHLDRSIVTGTWCRYRADPPVEWRVDRGLSS